MHPTLSGHVEDMATCDASCVVSLLNNSLETHLAIDTFLVDEQGNEYTS